MSEIVLKVQNRIKFKIVVEIAVAVILAFIFG